MEKNYNLNYDESSQDYVGDIFPGHLEDGKLRYLQKMYKAIPEEYYTKTKKAPVTPSPLTTGTAGILDCLNIKESSMKLNKILAAILTCCSTALPVVPGRYLQQSVTWTRLNENELPRYLLWTTSRRSSRREQRRKEATFSSSPGPALFGVNSKIYQENHSG